MVGVLDHSLDGFHEEISASILQRYQELSQRLMTLFELLVEFMMIINISDGVLGYDFKNIHMPWGSYIYNLV